MKLASVYLENFKFHKKITLKCKSKNILVYGENGVGKTSVFRAIYSILYYYKDNKMRQDSFRDRYINKSSLTERLKVNLEFNGGTHIVERVDNKVTGHELIKPKPTGSSEFRSTDTANVFMLEAKDLDQLLEGDFDKQIKKHFGNEYEVEVIYRELITAIKAGRSDLEDENEYKKRLRDLRLEKDKDYESKIKGLVDEIDINELLSSDFHWQDRILFEVEKSEIDFSVHPYKHTPPKINFYFENDPQKESVANYINEAKLKVLALTIFVCGIMKQGEQQLNLLVLDDFVNSLDMANRRFIVDSLLRNLYKYQIIIFTHNIHFYQLINRILNNSSQQDKWLTKKIFDFKSGSDFIEDKQDYLNEAKINLESGNLEVAANFLRKQFELICNRFEILLSLGKTEELNILLDELKSGGNFYKKPNEVIKELLKIFKKLNSNVESKTLSGHIGLAVEFNNKINSGRFIQGDNTKLFREITLMKDVLLNPASHNNPENTIHKAECEYAFKLVEKLTQNLKEIK